MALLNFDASTVKPQQPMEVIPAGTYNAAMTASAMVPTKDGAGAYLACEFTILDGDHKGRKVFTNLNLQNANPMAMQIAYEALSAICHATGVIQCADSAMLHDRPLQIVVKIKPATGEYDAKNEIKGYKAMTQAAPAFAPPAALPPAAFTPPAGAFVPPTSPAPAPAWAAPAAAAPIPVAPVAVPPAAAPVIPATPPWVKQ